MESQNIKGLLEEIKTLVVDLSQKEHKIALATSTGYEMVYISEILYCMAAGSYTEFHFKSDERLIVSKNLKYYENHLASYGFARSHQNTLVNLKYLNTLDKSGGGSITMEDGMVLQLSKSKKQDLENIIKQKRRLI